MSLSDHPTPIEDICAPEDPQRVVTLSGLGDALVLGVKPVGSIMTTYWGNQFPAYLGNQLDGIEKLGSDEQPNLEKITALKPDLIIGWHDSHESIYPILSRIAPTASSTMVPLAAMLKIRLLDLFWMMRDCNVPPHRRRRHLTATFAFLKRD